MSNKYLSYTPPVLAALRAGTPMVAIETGSFCRFEYPQNFNLLKDTEQAIWARNCVPVPMAVINGKIKAGLTAAEEEALMQHRISVTRAELPLVTARGKSAALLPSAAIAVAALAEIVPLLLPGFKGDVIDMDALALYGRMAFTLVQNKDTVQLMGLRNIPVTQDDPVTVAGTWICQQELLSPESVVYADGQAVTTLCDAACSAAVELKKRTDFN